MAPAQTDKATGDPTGGWRAVAAVTLMAAAAAVTSVWLIGSGLPGPSGAFFGRLLDLVGGWTVVVGTALAAEAAGAFLLYTARWQAMPGGAGPARGERWRGLVARVLLSVAASAMLLAIAAHGALYPLAGQARDCEFCGLAGFMLLFPVGLVALLAELIGLVMIGADPDLTLRVSVVLAFVTFVEPWLLLGFPAFPVMGVVLATAGIAALLAALVWLLRARPRPPMPPT
jgi:hypothetical protein